MLHGSFCGSEYELGVDYTRREVTIHSFESCIVFGSMRCYSRELLLVGITFWVRSFM